MTLGYYETPRNEFKQLFSIETAKPGGYTNKHSVVLKLVPTRQPGPEELTAVDREMIKLLGPKVDFRVVLMPEIPLKQGEKFRVSRSYAYSNFTD